MLRSIINTVTDKIDSGYNWCLFGIVPCRRRANCLWYVQNTKVSEELAHILNIIEERSFNRLSVSTSHAAIEGETLGSNLPYRALYLYQSSYPPSLRHSIINR